MFIEILCITFIGILIGIITGLTPGIHINLVSVMLISSAPFLLKYLSPLSLACFIISVAITHTFLDAIPSIYLGAPDESKALSVLPGHRFLLQGLGHTALLYTTIGAFAALLLALVLSPLLIFAMAFSYSFVNSITAYLLIGVMIFMILKENGLRKKLFSFVFFF